MCYLNGPAIQTLDIIVQYSDAFWLAHNSTTEPTDTNMDSDPHRISFLFRWPHEIIHKPCASWVKLRINHQNTGPLNARFFWIPDTLGVRYPNGLTWPNIRILNIFDHKQAFFRPEFRKPFEDWTIWKPDTKLPFQDWTSLVFRWLLFWQSLKAKICPTWFRD